MTPDPNRPEIPNPTTPETPPREVPPTPPDTRPEPVIMPGRTDDGDGRRVEPITPDRDA